jgi:hypothetical protein
MKMGRRISAQALLVLAACMWLLAIAAGLRGLWAYAYQPGRNGAVRSDWPVASAIPREPNRATLVMFIHPMCPCSAASAEELSRLMAKCDGKLSVFVAAVEPEKAPAEWTDSNLIVSIKAIPHLAVIRDRKGIEARRFGAVTSGYTCLYDARGRLRFSGGITPARGHAGDNAGSDAIVALLQNQVLQPQHTAVFGCALLDDDASTQQAKAQ